MLMKRCAQEAHNVGMMKSLEKLYLPLEASVLLRCSFGVRCVQAHLLYSYQLASASQATVYLVRRQKVSVLDRKYPRTLWLYILHV